MSECNLIIKASAGTGKTFSLATRFIRLMLFGKVRPERIIALTFSRAAAQEIYTKILERLWTAATGPQNEEAREERGFLLDGFELPAGMVVDFSRGNFARLLRALINTQHQGAISTLDSFILRIVGNFPQELGFQNAVEVLDGVAEQDAVDAAVDGMLAGGQAAEQVSETFKAIKGETFPRTCLDGIGEVLSKQKWRDFVLAHPGCEQWTVESISAELGVDSQLTPPDLSALVGDREDLPEAKFVKLVENYQGEDDFLPKGNKLREMIDFFWSHPSEESYTYEYRRKSYTVSIGTSVRAGLRYMMGLFLKRQLEIVVAKIRLVQLVEGEYHARTRRQGKLTFQDFTDYSAAQEGTEDELKLQNVEFRFDSKFEHWALDEFQDTSEVQWRCLNRLVRAAADGEGGRTVLAVGDQKQSIYTWRGASRKPFDELLSWAEFQPPRGQVTSIDMSHRYGTHTADFVNRVFGPTNTLIACPEWTVAWPTHTAGGQSDYVKVVAVVPDEDPDADDEILLALYAEIAAVWDEHVRTQSSESVGILVRGNEKGLAVANYLRTRGLPVVWEGMNSIYDLPVVQGVLNLLRLGDHPEDSLAWQMVHVLLPRIGALLPACTTAQAVSAEIRQRVSRQGLARTLKDFANSLCAPEAGLDNLSRERLSSLVRLAVDYEQRPTAEVGSEGFIRFLERTSQRELAVSTDVIRILTIHRSKGLTLDRVFVPLFECKGDGAARDGRSTAAIDRPKMSAPLYTDGQQWVLQHLPKGLEVFNPQTKLAFAQMCRERLLENLRTYYVALTRARRATYVLFPQDTQADRSKGLLMRDLVTQAVDGFTPQDLAGADGVVYGRLLYEAGEVPEMVARRSNVRTVAPWTLHAGTAAIQRVSPSDTGDRDWTTGDTEVSPFASDFGLAAEQGTEVHARFAAITWATADELAAMPESFRPAFVQPSDEATVWRERSYEIASAGRWESGQFDRVVFSGGRAVIYDFKTSAKKASESVAAFHERMQRQYRSQMDHYANALSSLTGLARTHIETKLLLTTTGTVLDLSSES